MQSGRGRLGKETNGVADTVGGTAWSAHCPKPHKRRHEPFLQPKHLEGR